MLNSKIENHVAIVTLARAEARNALNAAFWQDFPALMRNLDDNPSVRAMVIAGEGPHFCAGIDLDYLRSLVPTTADAARGSERLRRQILELQSALNIMTAIRKPVLAAVHGACMGAALDLVAAADMRYAATDAFFQIHEINIGMVADLGSLQRLPKQIPEGLLRELAFTGRRLSAEEARACGFVNAVLPDAAAVLAHALKMAHEIAEKSPLAVAGAKAVLNHAREHTVAEGLDYVATWNAGQLSFADVAMGAAAALQRQKTKFSDLS